MRALLADQPPGAGRALRRLLLALLVLLPAVASARAAEVEDRERWATRKGDDLQWSRPDLDDSSWEGTPLRSTWREQGLEGYDGMVWFRRNVLLDEAARLAHRRNELGLLVGPPSSGGYEVYADGRWIGRSRGWSHALAFGFPEVFPVPGDAIGDDGTVRLAFRVRRIGWASDRDPQDGPVSGVLTLGGRQSLEDRVRVLWTSRLLSELPLLILAALFGFSSLHHLLLFGRRRAQIEHLWFGLLALAFAINTLASTYWIYELTASRGLATRISDLTGHLAAAFAVQFLWSFFSRPISPGVRAYQLSHVALALFVALWPDLRMVFASAPARWLWLLPLLLIAAVLVVQQARRGDTDARIVAMGGAIMIVVQVVELTRNILPWAWPFDFPVAALGFGTVLVAMSLALSYRFRRVHEELDLLRCRLEDEVLSRTQDLAEARDEALAADRAKSEFLANISHEIRTPMNGLLGMAELLALSPLTEDQQKQLRTLQISGRSLLALLNDILDFSKLESGNLTVRRRPFSLRSVVEECLDVLAPLAAGKGLTLSTSLANNAVPAISGDQQRTRQVLLNLLSNAIKFTARGNVEVALSSRPLEDGQVEVRYSVADTGPGISEDDLGRLFVAFQQLDASSSRQHGGAGLGLAISKRLAELMGGTITVETAPGEGTIFHFTIVGEPASLSSAQPEDSPQPSPPGQSTLRVLVAEDEAINRFVILGMLRHLGYQAGAVTSGIEALHALELETYDVVLLDIQMPGMDGLEVTRRIRSGNGRQPHIIAVTAHAMAGDRERCLAAGMNAYLSKPLSLSELQQALAHPPRNEGSHS